MWIVDNINFATAMRQMTTILSMPVVRLKESGQRNVYLISTKQLRQIVTLVA